MTMKLKAFRLERITDKFTKHITQKNIAYKKLLCEEINKVKLRHAELMYDYEKNVEELLKARNSKLKVIIDEIMDQKAMMEMQEFTTEKKVKWEICRRKAKKRNDKECAICLQSLHNCKPLYLTSCTHVFHAACLSSFEHMSNIRKCPICRGKYDRIPMISR